MSSPPERLPAPSLSAERVRTLARLQDAVAPDHLVRGVSDPRLEVEVEATMKRRRDKPRSEAR